MNIEFIRAMRSEPHNSNNKRYADLIRENREARKRAEKQRNMAIGLGAILCFFSYAVGMSDRHDIVGKAARETAQDFIQATANPMDIYHR